MSKTEARTGNEKGFEMPKSGYSAFETRKVGRKWVVVGVSLTSGIGVWLSRPKQSREQALREARANLARGK